MAEKFEDSAASGNSYSENKKRSHWQRAEEAFDRTYNKVKDFISEDFDFVKSSDFHNILNVEQSYIRSRRDSEKIENSEELEEPGERCLSGIALSGGGIRSAAFSLGVLQALSREKIFSKFDYLSTVSGGGYTGSSITWLTSGKCSDFKKLNSQNFPYGDEKPGEPGVRYKENSILTHLRQRGNYLMPGNGVTVTSLVAVVLRSVIGNLIVWLPALVAVMILMNSFSELLHLEGVPSASTGSGKSFPKLYVVALGTSAALGASFILMAWFYGLGTWLAMGNTFSSWGKFGRRFFVLLVQFIVLAILVASVAVGLAVIFDTMDIVILSVLDSNLRIPRLPFYLDLDSLPFGGIKKSAYFYIGLAVSLFLYVRLMRRPNWRYDIRVAFEKYMRWPLWGAVLLLFVGSVPYVHRSFQELLNLEGVGVAGLLLSGLSSGVWAYRQSGKNGGGSLPTVLVAGIGGSLLIYGVFLLAYMVGGYGFVAEFSPESISNPPSSLYIRIDDSNYKFDWRPAGYLKFPNAYLSGFGLSGILFVWTLLSGFLVDTNLNSIHRYYRDRLMEAFLPGNLKASKAPVWDRAEAADETDLYEMCDIQRAHGPYHLINTNIVLVDSSNTKYRARGGDSFVLSPRYCGSEATGWRKTESYMDGDITLATAMAISGAAANPNTGVGGRGLTRSTIVSFLMTVLNLRLGYWAVNPNRDRGTKLEYISNRFSVPNHIIPGLLEAVWGHKENRRFIQLSDGGHFENLGLYELIRRKCRFIVVCDGGADKNFTFSDFNNASKRIENDFDVSIEPHPDFQLDGMISYQNPNNPGYPPGLEPASRGYAVATIKYRANCKGLLIVIKTTLTKDITLRLKGYKTANPDFPDQSTADQFFDEEQFDAYRELGYLLAESMVREFEKDEYTKNNDFPNLRDFIPEKETKEKEGLNPA